MRNGGGVAHRAPQCRLSEVHMPKIHALRVFARQQRLAERRVGRAEKNDLGVGSVRRRREPSTRSTRCVPSAFGREPGRRRRRAARSQSIDPSAHHQQPVEIRELELLARGELDLALLHRLTTLNAALGPASSPAAAGVPHGHSRTLERRHQSPSASTVDHPLLPDHSRTRQLGCNHAANYPERG
jgi:hypothetical protein